MTPASRPISCEYCWAPSQRWTIVWSAGRMTSFAEGCGMRRAIVTRLVTPLWESSSPCWY